MYDNKNIQFNWVFGRAIQNNDTISNIQDKVDIYSLKKTYLSQISVLTMRPDIFDMIL